MINLISNSESISALEIVESFNPAAFTTAALILGVTYCIFANIPGGEGHDPRFAVTATKIDPRKDMEPLVDYFKRKIEESQSRLPTIPEETEIPQTSLVAQRNAARGGSPLRSFPSCRNSARIDDRAVPLYAPRALRFQQVR